MAAPAPRPDAAAETERSSVAICFVREAIAGAQARGYDVGALLDDAGISPALLELPRARVSPDHYGRLWLLLAQAMDDEFFGLDSHPMRVGSFAMLCHATMDCSRLETALRRAVRFFGLVLDDVRASLQRAPGRATIEIRNRGAGHGLFAHAALLVMLHGLACWLVGRRIPILRTAFADPEPAHSDEYRLLFGVATRFGQGATTFSFLDSYLDLPVVRNRDALREFLQQAPANLLVKYKNSNSIASRIRQMLREAELSAWPDFAAIAERLHTTEATLRRRLDDEGQSFQAIKDDLRRDLAIKLLSHTRKSVMGIAMELGFAEASAFHRAFKKWTGASPGEYRRVLVEQDEGAGPGDASPEGGH